MASSNSSVSSSGRTASNEATHAGVKRSLSEASSSVDSAGKLARGENGERKVANVKGAWSPEEDEVLKTAVSKYGTEWKQVASAVQGRTAKQCRDRYNTKLDPSINHGPWTPEEDSKLLELKSKLGRLWTSIAKEMPGRTENSVKSRFASLERLRNREWTAEEDIILRACRERNESFQEISERYLTKRSEHSIKKRWEKLSMKELAMRIISEMPAAAGSCAPDLGDRADLHHDQRYHSAAGSDALKSETEASLRTPVAQDYRPPVQHMHTQYPAGPSHAQRLDDRVGAFDRSRTRFFHENPLEPPGSESSGGSESHYVQRMANPVSYSGSSVSTGVMSGPDEFRTGGEAHRTFQPPAIPTAAVPMLAMPPPSGDRIRASFQSSEGADSMLCPPLVPRVKAPPFDEQLGGDATATSARSGNMKRQSTSVTVLQQIIREPLNNNLFS